MLLERPLLPSGVVNAVIDIDFVAFDAFTVDFVNVCGSSIQSFPAFMHVGGGPASLESAELLSSHWLYFTSYISHLLHFARQILCFAFHEFSTIALLGRSDRYTKIWC